MKNQKWIYVIIAVIAISIGVFYFYNKGEKELVSSDAGTNDTGAPAGQANSINDLSADCQEKAEGFYNWMNTAQAAADWKAQFLKTAAARNSTLKVEVLNHWLRTYNKGTDSKFQC